MEFVDYRIKESSEANAKALATKEDIVRLEARIAEAKTDLIKWMVSLIIGLFVALVGTMTALMNFIK